MRVPGFIPTPTFAGTLVGLLSLVLHWCVSSSYHLDIVAFAALVTVGLGGLGIALHVYAQEQNRPWSWRPLLSAAKPSRRVLTGFYGHLAQAAVAFTIAMFWKFG